MFKVCHSNEKIDELITNIGLLPESLLPSVLLIKPYKPSFFFGIYNALVMVTPNPTAFPEFSAFFVSRIVCRKQDDDDEEEEDKLKRHDPEDEDEDSEDEEDDDSGYSP